MDETERDETAEPPRGGDRDRLAAEFERVRPRLRAVAYRMLGSMTEADDAVQEAWLRLDRREPELRDPSGRDGLEGWLVTVVGRICLDVLRTRRSRREDYEGTWLPEPLVTSPADTLPEGRAVLAESVGLALLVVLEALSPAERLAFVLHDVFGVPFGEIAAVLGASPAAARQLASRGRRRVREQAPRPDADLTVQRRVVDAFVAASRNGDIEALVAVLDPDVVVRTDGGGHGPFARPAVRGARQVAEQALRRGTPFARFAEPAIVNGAAGLVIRVPNGLRIVLGFAVVGGRIATIDIVADQAKLAGLGSVAPAGDR